MPTIIDLTSQVQKILPALHGGTGTQMGYARDCLFLTYANNTGGTITRRTLVAVPDANGDGKLGKTTVANQTEVAGVVIGRVRTDVGHVGEFIDDDVDADEFAAVALVGKAWVDVEAAVNVGDYAYASNTDGKAKGQAFIDIGAFGIFEASSGSTAGLVRMFAAPSTPGMVGALPCRLGDGVTLLQVNTMADVRVPFNLQITGWSMMAKDVGSVVVDVYVDTWANFPPTGGDSITGSDTPTISAGVKAESTALTGWTTDLTAGDTLRFNVESASGLSQVTCQLAFIRR